MSSAGIVAILVIVVLVLYGIGRVLRNKPHWLQIAGLTAVVLVVFLSVALAISGGGIGVYEYYQFENCQGSNPKCSEAGEKADFDARVPRLTVLMTVPKPLRPACETISPEFCVLEKTWDFSEIGYIVGAFGTLIAIFIVLLGLRRKLK